MCLADNWLFEVVLLFFDELVKLSKGALCRELRSYHYDILSAHYKFSALLRVPICVNLRKDCFGWNKKSPFRRLLTQKTAKTLG